VAEWYELRTPMILHLTTRCSCSLGRGRDPERALHYLERRASKPCAIMPTRKRYASSAMPLALAEQVDITVEPFRRAHWERLLGEAYFAWASWLRPESITSAPCSFWPPVPATNAAGIGKRLRSNWGGRPGTCSAQRPAPGSPEKRKVYLEAAKANKRLARSIIIQMTKCASEFGFIYAEPGAARQSFRATWL